MLKPHERETVGVEYPPGRHFHAAYDAHADAFVARRECMRTARVANGSRAQHEDTDIGGAPTLPIKGKLKRS